MSEGAVNPTTLLYDSQSNVAQVTNYDVTAELFGQWLEQMPPITTALAYMEAVRLHDALLRQIEGFEMSAAFKRITGAQ